MKIKGWSWLRNMGDGSSELHIFRTLQAAEDALAACEEDCEELCTEIDKLEFTVDNKGLPVPNPGCEEDRGVIGVCN